MRRSLLTGLTTLALACGGHPKPATTPTPVNPAAPPPPPAVNPPANRATDGIRLGPSALRYLIHQSLHAEQQLQGQTQVIDRGTKLFVTATIVGPADSLGYRLTLTVDSIALDSGTTVPGGLDLTNARGLVYDGRLTTNGKAALGLVSDTARAAPFIQLIDVLKTFYPALPKNGVTPGADWSDSSTTLDHVVVEVTRRSANRSRATTWEQQGATRILTIEKTATYAVAGSGTQSNQPVEVSGTGVESSRYVIAADGRYLGGEASDSSSITVTLPYQNATVPAIRVLRSTVAVLP